MVGVAVVIGHAAAVRAAHREPGVSVNAGGG
jgi:hypothetical protein